MYTPGLNGTGPFLHRYNPGTDTWTKRATPPHANTAPASGVIDGKFYLAGSYGPGGPATTLDVYDPATDTWRTRKTMPRARAEAAGRAFRGKLYIVGGISGNGYGWVDR